jgi:asparagine synthase (glutamine-hydrolysing)
MYAVPWEFKEYGGKEKGILRKAMEGVLPNEVLWRKKSPYPKTYDPRYLTLVRDRLEALLRRKDAPLFQILKKDAVSNLLHAELTWPWYGQLMKVPQTISYMLQLNYWLKTYGVQIV